MQSRKTSLRPHLSPEDREALKAILRKQAIEHALWRRVSCILTVADGASVSQAAREHRLSRQHLMKWLKRWHQEGLAGLEDRRTGRPRRKGRIEP